jgi:pimeloyl-ACP methyl ester carboxylesterase
MLHGVGRAGRTFSGLATMLPARFDITALDFRGHGASGRAGDRYRIVDYVADGLAAVDAVTERVVLYGHSLGSLVAAAVAGLRPDRVRAVILEDPPSAAYWQNLPATQYYATFQAMRKLAGQPLSIQEMARQFGLSEIKVFSDGRVLRIDDVRDPVSIRFTASCLQQLDPEVMEAVLAGRWPEQFDFESVFRAVQCPTLLLRGNVAQGGMLPEDDADRMMGWLKDGLRIDFPGAGHLLHWQMRVDVALNTGAFLESLG